MSPHAYRATTLLVGAAAYAFVIALVVLLLSCAPVFAKTHRSMAVRRAYLKSLGLTKTPGKKGQCQVDHALPLERGGKDEVGNLELICGPVLQRKEQAERNPKTWETYKQECLPHER